MAKAKKNKSAKSGKLPKTVAGIELPKELRKQGAKLLDLIKNPMVGDLVAAGLVALAANVRNQGKTGNDSTKDKQSAVDGFSKTAANLATVVAARAAEKITSKLGERPAAATPKPPAPAAASKPAARKPVARKPATTKAPAKPAPTANPATSKPATAKSATTKPAAAKRATAKAAAKPATAKPKAPPARKPAAKTATRKPAARKPAAKPVS